MVQPLKRLLKPRTQPRRDTHDRWMIDDIPPLGDMAPQRFGVVMMTQSYIWEIREALREKNLALDAAVFRIAGDHIPEPKVCTNVEALTQFLERYFADWCVDVSNYAIHRPPPDRKNAAPRPEFHLLLEKVYDNLDAKPCYPSVFYGVDKPVPQTLQDDAVLILCDPMAEREGWDRLFSPELGEARIVVEQGDWTRSRQADHYYAILDNEVRNAALTKLGQLVVYVDRWGNGLCTHLYGDVKQRKLSVIERRWHSWAFWGDSVSGPFKSLVPQFYDKD